MGSDRRATRATRSALALGLFALSLPSVGRAQESGRFRMAWARDEGAERCPDGPTIEREVSRRLGYDPFVRAAGPSIEASVRRTDARWIARIVVRDAADAQVGVREFTSETPDCTAITLSVTLGVALSIDPDAALRPPTPPPPPPAPAVVAPRPPRDLVLARAAGLSLRAVGAVGLLPSASLGASLTAEGPIKARWRWTLGATWLPETEVTTPAGVFSFGFVAVFVGPCFDVWRARVMSLTACAGPSLGTVRSVVRQGVPSEPGDRPWVAGFASVRFRVRLVGPLGAEAGLEGDVPFVRHRFHDGVDRTVFQQAPVAAIGFVGLGLQFQ